MTAYDVQHITPEKLRSSPGGQNHPIGEASSISTPLLSNT